MGWSVLTKGKVLFLYQFLLAADVDAILLSELPTFVVYNCFIQIVHT